MYLQPKCVTQVPTNVISNPYETLSQSSIFKKGLYASYLKHNPFINPFYYNVPLQLINPVSLRLYIYSLPVQNNVFISYQPISTKVFLQQLLAQWYNAYLICSSIISNPSKEMLFTKFLAHVYLRMRQCATLI